jgi:hypothetical protein
MTFRILFISRKPRLAVNWWIGISETLHAHTKPFSILLSTISRVYNMALVWRIGVEKDKYTVCLDGIKARRL